MRMLFHCYSCDVKENNVWENSMRDDMQRYSKCWPILGAILTRLFFSSSAGYELRSELSLETVAARAQRAGIYEHAVLLVDSMTGETKQVLSVAQKDDATACADTVRTRTQEHVPSTMSTSLKKTLDLYWHGHHVLRFLCVLTNSWTETFVSPFCTPNRSIDFTFKRNLSNLQRHPDWIGWSEALQTTLATVSVLHCN